jgi:DNA-directed RNA polymerase sigma subunit (sigma70/sigma32)
VKLTDLAHVNLLTEHRSVPTVLLMGEPPVLAQLKRAGKRLARARADIDELIIKAADEGHSLRVLANASGVSHERVRQLLQRRSK